MAEKRVIEQVASTEVYNDDWIPKDSSTQGTTKIQPSALKEYFNEGQATEADLTALSDDISLGADGTVYPSAGDAVRAQVGTINNSLFIVDNPDYTINNFVLGDFNGVIIQQSTYRMVGNLYIPTNRILTTDWTKYMIYVWKKVSGTWTAVGWKMANYECAPAPYIFVVSRRSGSTAGLTQAEQNEINSIIKLVNNDFTDNVTDIINNNISLPRDVIQYIEILPCAYGLDVTKDSSNNYIIKLNPAFFYTRNLGTSGDTYATRACNSEYTLSNLQGLYYDTENKSLVVLNVTPNPISFRYVLLLLNHAATLRGAWAAYCFYDMNKKALKATLPSHRIMSRQGEGYGYPDNSLEGITAALKDGYKMIRISVAVTSDNEFYCTHDYELMNNSTYKLCKINGELYPNDIDITQSTSAFINSLTYKEYAIPTLDSVMSEIAKHSGIISITWELKNVFTDAQLQLLINKSNYYNIPVVFSAILSDMDQLTAVNTELNIAPIIQYTSVISAAVKTRYEGKYKTMRFDCYWNNTITATQVSEEIHPNFKVKMGADTIPTVSQIMSNYIKWVDVAEVNYPISQFTN